MEVSAMTNPSVAAAIALVGAFMLAACRGGPSDAPEVRAEDCPLLASRDWTAHVNRMPGPGASPTLHVQGEVDLPTPGFQPVLRATPIERGTATLQWIVMDFAPPTQIVAQVVSTQVVRFAGPASDAAYAAVRVTCAGEVIAEITDVPDVS
jgi:hypothetical protein